MSWKETFYAWCLPVILFWFDTGIFGFFFFSLVWDFFVCSFWGGFVCSVLVLCWFFLLLFQIITNFTVLGNRIGGKENTLLFQISNSFH